MTSILNAKEQKELKQALWMCFSKTRVILLLEEFTEKDEKRKNSFRKLMDKVTELKKEVEELLPPITNTK